jgi:hypothetical protein
MMETLNNVSFCFGTFYGLVVGGIIALIANRMREERVRMGHKDRTYDQFPDSLHPTLKAGEVAKRSREATLTYSALFVVMLVFIGLASAGVFFILQG